MKEESEVVVDETHRTEDGTIVVPKFKGPLPPLPYPNITLPPAKEPKVMITFKHGKQIKNPYYKNAVARRAHPLYEYYRRAKYNYLYQAYHAAKEEIDKDELEWTRRHHPTLLFKLLEASARLDYYGVLLEWDDPKAVYYKSAAQAPALYACLEMYFVNWKGVGFAVCEIGEAVVLTGKSNDYSWKLDRYTAEMHKLYEAREQ